MMVVVAPFTTVVVSSSSSQSYSSSSSSSSWVGDALADAVGALAEGEIEGNGEGEAEGEKEGEGDAEGDPGLVLGTDHDQTQPVAAGFDLRCQLDIIGLVRDCTHEHTMLSPLHVVSVCHTPCAHSASRQRSDHDRFAKTRCSR